MTVHVKDYTIHQSYNGNDVYILKNDKLVFRGDCTKRFKKKQLIKWAEETIEKFVLKGEVKGE